ncbi:MAG TPA: hypothetical protein VNI83_04375 [Vicinamibacterales bacterium]|nr:hypothetical protein [Vicinamibacterales bacterium]
MKTRVLRSILSVAFVGLASLSYGVGLEDMWQHQARENPPMSEPASLTFQGLGMLLVARTLRQRYAERARSAGRTS